MAKRGKRRKKREQRGNNEGGKREARGWKTNTLCQVVLTLPPHAHGGGRVVQGVRVIRE